ncbi:hypothetical protein H6503_04190 [Candidatus Woesearchaeota archaeon]|nr:hypothetical protein [Candidatus Woesearchaeota archaeon]
MQNLILTGPQGSGKTRTGRIIADRLGIDFFDADTMINNYLTSETIYKDIADLVDWEGWVIFRRVESYVIKQLMDRHLHGEYKNKNFVLATGGGAVAHDQGTYYRFQNIKNIRNMGRSIYMIPYLDIDRSARILSERVIADETSAKNRPNLIDGFLDNPQGKYQQALEILSKRHEIYRKVTDFTVVTGEYTADAVASLIIQTFFRDGTQ